MEKGEFKKVFDEYRMRVFFFCKKILDHQEDAEDATVNTFVKLWRQSDKAEMTNVEAFLMIAAKNCCLDILKAHKRYKDKIDKYASQAVFEQTEVTTYVLKYIYDIIEELPPKQKEIFKLKYFDEMEPREISKLLNKPRQTVQNILAMSMKTIREEVKSRGIKYNGLN